MIFFQIYPKFAHLHRLSPPRLGPIQWSQSQFCRFCQNWKVGHKTACWWRAIRCQPHHLRRWLCHETRWFHKKRKLREINWCWNAGDLNHQSVWQKGRNWIISNNERIWKVLIDTGIVVLSDDSKDTPFLLMMNSLYRGCWQVDSCWCVKAKWFILVHLGLKSKPSADFDPK